MVTNLINENYLRCYCIFHQNDWDVLFPTAEFAHNSARSEDLGASSFQIDLGYQARYALVKISNPNTPNDTTNEFKALLQSVLDETPFAL